jgi:hypothetical protein
MSLPPIVEIEDISEEQLDKFLKELMKELTIGSSSGIQKRRRSNRERKPSAKKRSSKKLSILEELAAMLEKKEDYWTEGYSFSYNK